MKNPFLGPVRVGMGGAVCLVLPWLLAPVSALSQVLSPAVTQNPPANGGNLPYPVGFLSRREFWLSLLVLLFGTIACFLVYRLFLTRVPRSEEIMRTFTVILIIIGTLLLITAGFSERHIAPAFGLFGTIAGYLIGRGDLMLLSNQRANRENRNG